MKTRFFIFVYVFLTMHLSCQSDRYTNFLGTWQPAYGDNNSQLIERIQFMKLNNFYIAAIKYAHGNSNSKVFFYVCQENNGSLIIKPENYFRESDIQDRVLTKPTVVYFDAEFKNLYLTNSVFELAQKNIFYFNNGKLQILD